jgi:hypothetical protein
MARGSYRRAPSLARRFAEASTPLMNRLRRRLAEADAAVTALEEALRVASRSAIERDSAILRLIYSYQSVWKACQRLLAERDDIEIGSPNDAVRAARRLGWLSDEDAEAAMKIGSDCNLAVQTYSSQISTEIKDRLPAHAAVLRRWLAALREKATDTSCQAKPIYCSRRLCETRSRSFACTRAIVVRSVPSFLAIRGERKEHSPTSLRAKAGRNCRPEVNGNASGCLKRATSSSGTGHGTPALGT